MGNWASNFVKRKNGFPPMGKKVMLGFWENYPFFFYKRMLQIGGKVKIARNGENSSQSPRFINFRG